MTLDAAFHSIQPRPYSSATSIWARTWSGVYPKSCNQGRTTTFLDNRSIPSWMALVTIGPGWSFGLSKSYQPEV